MVRSAYGIGDRNDWSDDFYLSLFCSCCVVNQIYQTTKIRRNVAQDGGRTYNQRPNPINPHTNQFHNCFRVLFCTPCTIGTMLNDAMGMPWYLGCCCMNFCIARNVLRYQFRYKAATNDDCLEECFFPFLAPFLSNILSKTCVPCADSILCSMFYSSIMDMVSAVEVEKNAQPLGHGYLIGYHPGESIHGCQRVVICVM